MSMELWFNNLTPNQRKALVLSKAYERERRKAGHVGYRCFPETVEGVTDNPVFKQFETVTNWLVDKGWNVSWSEDHWQGYVLFVFKALAPTVPLPGQLKNSIFLRKYILSVPKSADVSGRSPEQLKRLYSTIIRPEVLSAGFDEGITPE